MRGRTSAELRVCLPAAAETQEIKRQNFSGTALDKGLKTAASKLNRQKLFSNLWRQLGNQSPYKVTIGHVFSSLYKLKAAPSKHFAGGVLFYNSEAIGEMNDKLPKLIGGKMKVKPQR